MNYITLTSEDPEFQSYLLGTFSNTHRALPVETYSGGSSERVTFQIMPLEKIKQPAWWKIYFRSCRPELLPLTLAPAVAAWLSHPGEFQQWTRVTSWLAMIGVLFLHTAMFLYNDVQDHLRGADRSNFRRGSRVIQKGWVTAFQMRRWALVNGGLAVLFGGAAFFNSPLAFLTICLAAGVALAVIAMNRWTAWGASDLAIFLLFGPLLTAGVAVASYGVMGPIDFLIGSAYGVLTLWVFQIRQFENLFRSKPESFYTFLGHCTFDRARLIVVIEGILILLFQLFLALVLRAPLVLMVMIPLVSWPMIVTIEKIRKAASPLSSQLIKISRFALIGQLAWALWWIAVLGIVWL